MMSPLVAALSALLAVSDPSDGDVAFVPTVAVADGDARVLLAAANAERASSGMPQLSTDDSLSRIAVQHALEMARTGVLTHDSPDGSSPWDRFDRAGIAFSYAGENVAIGPGPAEAASDLWNSPEHRRNTLEPHFARVGVAAVETGDGEVFVEDFAG